MTPSMMRAMSTRLTISSGNDMPPSLRSCLNTPPTIARPLFNLLRHDRHERGVIDGARPDPADAGGEGRQVGVEGISGLIDALLTEQCRGRLEATRHDGIRAVRHGGSHA